MREFQRLFVIQYTASDIEFIINNLESSLTDLAVNIYAIETLKEIIDSYEGTLSDELDRKYDRIKDKLGMLNRKNKSRN